MPNKKADNVKSLIEPFLCLAVYIPPITEPIPIMLVKRAYVCAPPWKVFCASRGSVTVNSYAKVPMIAIISKVVLRIGISKTYFMELVILPYLHAQYLTDGVSSRPSYVGQVIQQHK